jgi:hypothetical protein
MPASGCRWNRESVDLVTEAASHPFRPTSASRHAARHRSVPGGLTTGNGPRTDQPRARCGAHALASGAAAAMAWIYNLTLRIVHHPEDAKDATQEVLIKPARDS